jgi:hypothetical protein
VLGYIAYVRGKMSGRPGAASAPPWPRQLIDCFGDSHRRGTNSTPPRFARRASPQAPLLWGYLILAIIVCCGRASAEGAAGGASPTPAAGACSVDPAWSLYLEQLAKANVNAKEVWPQRLSAISALNSAVGLIGVGCATAYASLLLSRREKGDRADQSLHEERLKRYPKLIKATEPLALYFPEKNRLTPSACETMGNNLRQWYFEGGGLLLGDEALKAYF